ncbi:2-dehydropantoate 2-reductase [Phyllosticta capitalensis]|uniref:2-dehydropantoate 2-reductase n=1 Tax=Phyllosticta capitalensis TaxID=121624 RepID=A0ABR1YFI1_9PEZI
MTSSTPRILIFGTGSIGSVYAWLLSRAGCDVTCICRSNFSHVRDNGITIHSQVFGSDLHCAPRVYATVQDAVDDDNANNRPAYDFVLVAAKAIPGTTPPLIAPALAADTTALVLLQNGIAIEDEYAAAFPSTPLLSGVVYLPATQTSPGVITMGNTERLEVGAYPASPVTSGRSGAALRELMELVQRGSGTIVLFDDVQPRRWAKLLVNAAWNPTCALTKLRDVEFLESGGDDAHAFVWATMAEVVAVARACGYDEINEDEARRQLERATARMGTKGVEPSMLADVRAGRALEVEAIMGNCLRVARQRGVETPNLAALYVLAKGLDDSLRQERRQNE